MAYWLWMVMDWALPELWDESLRRGIAAQEYPEDYSIYTQYMKNVKAMRRIAAGDWIIARCRGDLGPYTSDDFLGYGRVTREYYYADDADSLDIARKNEDTGQMVYYALPNRLDVEWFAFPGTCKEGWKPCRLVGVRKQFPDVKFKFALCVSEISEESFFALKESLDHAGATRIYPRFTRRGKDEIEPSTLWDDIGAEAKPARKRQSLVTVPVRDPRNRMAAKARAGWKCEVPRCRERTFLQRGTDHPYVEAHHLEPLSEKGVEHLSNIAVVCSWHHALLTHGPEKDAEKVARQLRQVRAAEPRKRA